MKSLAPNTLLQNRYLVVHLIGKGGMGDVYLAVDQRLGSAVALKRTFFANDEMLGGAFEREAKTLARLRHPVLPKVSDHFTENEEQYLVMEHISGDDLSKRLEAAQKPFPISWVLFWADQLLDALAYLHAHEPPIIHRDIKPQNLKLTDENSVILLDFGLSKNNAGETRALSGGSTGSVVGYTPHYAPMEQIRGTGTNPRSDIYSLSATVYQLMTNVVPPDALTRADTLLNGMSDPVKPIDELNPEIPPTVSQVILKGMELSQDKRYASAREMQKALREAFAQLQTAMTAQTIAFNLQSENIPAQAAAPPSVRTSEKNEKAEALNGAPANFDSAAPPHSISAPAPPAVQNADDFDSTLKMNPPSAADSQPKQSDVKTEVFLAGENPLTTAPAKKVPATKEIPVAREQESEDYSATGDFTSRTSRTDADFPAAAPEDADFYTSPNINQEVDAFATFTPTRDYSATDFSEDSALPDEREEPARQYDSPPKQAAAPAKKKSAGKAAAVAGGVFALLALVVGAVGAVWFFYNKNQAQATIEISTPTPAPTAEFTPTPEPTVEIAVEATNTNAANAANADIVSGDANEAANTDAATDESANVAPDAPRTVQTTPPAVASQRTPAAPAVRNTPPRTNPGQQTAKPTPKPTAKPAAKKPDAPVILQ